MIDNCKGIPITISGNHNTVDSNVITRQSDATRCGIEIWDGDYNIFSNNKLYSIGGARMIYITKHYATGCNYNRFIGNILTASSNYYVQITDAPSTGNVFENNTFAGTPSGNGLLDSGTGTIYRNNVGLVSPQEQMFRTTSTRPRWYTSPLACTALTTSGAVTSGRMYAMPYITDKACTLDNFSINVTTLVAGGHMRVGIYLNANGEPGALLVEAATPFDTSGTGVKTTAGVSVAAARHIVLAGIAPRQLHQCHPGGFGRLSGQYPRERRHAADRADNVLLRRASVRSDAVDVPDRVARHWSASIGLCEVERMSEVN